MRGPRRGAASMLLACILALPACGPGAAQRSAEPPACRADNRTVILFAQAVPTAARIPCIAYPPADWGLRAVEVHDGVAEFGVWTERFADRSLDVALVPRCRASGGEVESGVAGTRLFVDSSRRGARVVGVRAYVFPGGCVLVRFDFPADDREAFEAAAARAIGLMPRAAVERELARDGFRL